MAVSSAFSGGYLQNFVFPVAAPAAQNQSRTLIGEGFQMTLFPVARHAAAMGVE